MKILILCTKMPWPPRDGGSIATLNLALGLAGRGAEITLLTMNTGKHYFPPDEVPAGLRQGLNLISVDVDTKIRAGRLIRNLLFSTYPYNAERFVSKPFRDKLRELQKEESFDIVQLEGPYLLPYLKYLKGDAKIALRAHNIEHRIWELRSGEEKNPVKSQYYGSLARRIKKLETRLLSDIDMLVPISDSDAEGLSSLRPHLPLQVCPTGLDLTRYPASSGSTGSQNGDILNHLFYIGALDWAPNQEGLDWFFLKVWPLLLGQFPDIRLFIAGRNPGQYFRDIPPENTILEGEVDDALEFFSGHRIMLVPLLSGSGIRIKILEAMAMAKTVICTPIAAEGLSVENGKHLFIAETPEEFTEVLKRLDTEHGLLGKTGRNARQFINENFDNLEISDRLITFYKKHLA